jgi:hypothetical protein
MRAETVYEEGGPREWDWLRVFEVPVPIPGATRAFFGLSLAVHHGTV